MRAISILFALLLVAATDARGADPAPIQMPVTLRSAVTVEGATVTLGDLFLGLDRNADKIVATAPAPGERVVLEANWLARVARAYQVNWQPTTRLDRVSLARAGQPLERPSIDALLQQSLVREGLTGDYEIELDNRLGEVNLPVDADEPARITRLQVDRRTMRFSAQMVAPANHPESRRYALSGRLHEQAVLPVLGRRVQPGDQIDERDLVWLKVRADQVTPATLTDAGQVIGQAPRRALAPNKPLTTADIEPPMLVKKNAVVTVTFRQPGMELTGQAKATQNATLGETVRVVNLSSNKQFDAVVVGRGAVAVGAVPRARLASIQGN